MHFQPAMMRYIFLFWPSSTIVEEVSNREIMMRLYISEGTFNRTRRSAVRALARALGEMEAAIS
jgi:hypothetical protein